MTRSKSHGRRGPAPAKTPVERAAAKPPPKGLMSGRDAIVMHILDEMSQGFWGPGKHLEVRQRFGVGSATVLEAATEASRHLRLVVGSNAEDIRAQAASTLQALSVEAREDKQFKAAVDAVNVLTRLWGLQTVVHETKNTKIPSHLSGRALLEYLETQIAEFSDMRDQLRSKLLEQGAIVVAAESSTGWACPPVEALPFDASPSRGPEGSPASAAGGARSLSAPEGPLGPASEPD